MSSDVVEAFEASLLGTATAERVSVEEFEDAIADHVEPPAVGTPLPFEGVSLSNAGVELDPTPVEIRDANTGVTPAPSRSVRARRATNSSRSIPTGTSQWSPRATSSPTWGRRSTGWKRSSTPD